MSGHEHWVGCSFLPLHMHRGHSCLFVGGGVKAPPSTVCNFSASLRRFSRFEEISVFCQHAPPICRVKYLQMEMFLQLRYVDGAIKIFITIIYT